MKYELLGWDASGRSFSEYLVTPPTGGLRHEMTDKHGNTVRLYREPGAFTEIFCK